MQRGQMCLHDSEGTEISYAPLLFPGNTHTILGPCSARVSITQGMG